MYIQCLLPRVIEGQSYAMANLQSRTLKAYRFSYQRSCTRTTYVNPHKPTHWLRTLSNCSSFTIP